jgi:hypothetical protein
MKILKGKNRELSTENAEQRQIELRKLSQLHGAAINVKLSKLPGAAITVKLSKLHGAAIRTEQTLRGGIRASKL